MTQTTKDRLIIIGLSVAVLIVAGLWIGIDSHKAGYAAGYAAGKASVVVDTTRIAIHDTLPREIDTCWLKSAPLAVVESRQPSRDSVIVANAKKSLKSVIDSAYTYHFSEIESDGAKLAATVQSDSQPLPAIKGLHGYFDYQAPLCVRQDSIISRIVTEKVPEYRVNWPVTVWTGIACSCLGAAIAAIEVKR